LVLEDATTTNQWSNMVSQYSPLLHHPRNRDVNSYQSIVPALNNGTSTTTNGVVLPNHANGTGKSTNKSSSTISNKNNNHHLSLSPSSIQLRPMGYLSSSERRNRHRFIAIMIVLSGTIVLSILLWCWYIHSPTVPSIHSDNSGHHKNNTLRTYNEMQLVANMAMNRLNNFHRDNGDDNNAPHNFISNDCETTLLVMRHCDKLETDDENDEDTTTNPSNDDPHRRHRNMKHRDRHCSFVGYERADYIATLFGNTSKYRYPIPKNLYALSANRSNNYMNYREWETLYPLSKMINVSITVVDDTFATQHYFPLLQSGTLCGQIAVLSWKHSLIPDLVNSLGCGPENGCPMTYPIETFDQVWQIKYVFHPTGPKLDDTTIPNNSMSQRDDQTTPTPTENVTTSSVVVIDPTVSTFHLHSNKHHRHHHHQHDRLPPAPPIWNMSGYWTAMGTVTNQMFDPLDYSKKVGKYP
jgi:hypothetical protein